jgi:hypothetical protein
VKNTPRRPITTPGKFSSTPGNNFWQCAFTGLPMGQMTKL